MWADVETGDSGGVVCASDPRMADLVSLGEVWLLGVLCGVVCGWVLCFRFVRWLNREV